MIWAGSAPGDFMKKERNCILIPRRALWQHLLFHLFTKTSEITFDPPLLTGLERLEAFFCLPHLEFSVLQLHFYCHPISIFLSNVADSLEMMKYSKGLDESWLTTCLKNFGSAGARIS